MAATSQPDWIARLAGPGDLRSCAQARAGGVPAHRGDRGCGGRDAHDEGPGRRARHDHRPGDQDQGDAADHGVGQVDEGEPHETHGAERGSRQQQARRVDPAEGLRRPAAPAARRPDGRERRRGGEEGPGPDADVKVNPHSLVLCRTASSLARKKSAPTFPKKASRSCWKARPSSSSSIRVEARDHSVLAGPADSRAGGRDPRRARGSSKPIVRDSSPGLREPSPPFDRWFDCNRRQDEAFETRLEYRVGRRGVRSAASPSRR